VFDSPDQAVHYHSLGFSLRGAISDPVFGTMTYYFTFTLEKSLQIYLLLKEKLSVVQIKEGNVV
jgi:hypothetical protein